MLACTEMITMCLQSAKQKHLRAQQLQQPPLHSAGQGLTIFHDQDNAHHLSAKKPNPKDLLPVSLCQTPRETPRGPVSRSELLWQHKRDLHDIRFSAEQTKTIVLYREEEVLECECDMAMVHHLLSQIPQDLPFDPASTQQRPDSVLRRRRRQKQAALESSAGGSVVAVAQPSAARRFVRLAVMGLTLALGAAALALF